MFRVDVDGTPYVLRVLDPAVSAAGLGIPADLEIENRDQALRDLTDPGLGRLIDLAAHRGAAPPTPTPPSRRL